MTSDPDIFRAANLMIDQHGEEAMTFAAGSYRAGIRGGGKTVVPTPGEGSGVVSEGASSVFARSVSCWV
jgi:hypothetical protein